MVRWQVRDFLGIRKLNPKEPVCHVTIMRQMHIVNGQEKEFQQKQNGKKLMLE